MSEPQTPTPTPKISRRKKILRGVGIAFLLLLVIGIVQFWPRPHDTLTRYIPKDALLVVKIEPYTFFENIKNNRKEMTDGVLFEKLLEEDTLKEEQCQLPKNPLKFGIDLQHTLWSRGGEIYAFSMADSSGLPSTYHALLALTNKNKFNDFLEIVFCEDTFTIDQGNNSSQLTMADSSVVVTWDHEVAMFSFGNTEDLSSIQDWARHRVENPDRKNCIEQHPDFEEFRKEAEEMAVFVNIDGITSTNRELYAEYVEDMSGFILPPEFTLNGMSSIQMHLTVDSGRFVLSSSFHGEELSYAPFAFLADHGLSDKALDNLHSNGSPQVALSLALDMDTLYNQINTLLDSNSAIYTLDDIDEQLDDYFEAVLSTPKPWHLKDLFTAFDGEFATGVGIDLVALEDFKPIEELNLHIGENSEELGTMITQLSQGFVSDRGTDIELILESKPSENDFYENQLFVLPSQGRQFIKTADGYGLILGMKDGLDTTNLKGYKDDVDYFINHEGYGKQGVINDEIREVLQKNPVALYISLDHQDYGKKFKEIVKDVMEMDGETKVKDQVLDEIVNRFSHLSFSINPKGEFELVLELKNTKDNPLYTIWDTLERLAKEGI